jgi:hypothetical protein
MSLEIYNNFVYSNVGGFATWASATGSKCCNIYRNNLLYKNYNSLNGVQSDSYNNWNLSVTVTDADFVSLDVSQLLRPRKADGSLPDITFGHLVAGSDLIDKGVNVGLPYSGSAPDLGAFETQ